MDLGETVRAIDNMRLVVHEGGRAHAQVVSREGEGRSSVSSRGSTSAANSNSNSNNARSGSATPVPSNEENKENDKRRQSR